MKYIAFILITILLASCTTLNKKTVTIETEPIGAAILVNGAYVGDSPIQANISSGHCAWVGLMNSPNGKICTPVLIEAQPKGKTAEHLYTQQVRVDPDTMVSSSIFMNLRLEPIMPTQSYQIK